MSKLTYLLPDILPATHTYVSYKLLRASGSVYRSFVRAACFSDLTYKAIDESVHSILIHRPMSEIPYGRAAIIRWIEDISAMGFPCRVAFEGKVAPEAHFTVRLDAYTHKPHLTSALMLIRCLFEAGCCYVPEAYFRRIDRAPNSNRFLTMQRAHKVDGQTMLGSGTYGGNDNHMLTSADNGSATSVPRSLIFKRFEEADCPVRGAKYASISTLWRNPTPNARQQELKDLAARRKEEAEGAKGDGAYGPVVAVFV